MSTRNLPTPPPDGTTVPSTEADQAIPQTTDVEEAAAPTNQPPPPQPQPTQIHTIYREAFPAIANKAIDKDWVGLTMFAELQDLRTEHDADASRMLLTAPLVLSYLILDDIPPARFALARLPAPLAHHSLTEALFSLVASASERIYSRVYVRARALVEILSADPDLSIFGPTMARTFIVAFQTRTFNLISKAYTSIPLPLAEFYLGLRREELLPAVTRLKWTHDPATGILTPARPQNVNARKTQRAVSGPSNLFMFDVVTNGVALLES